MRTPITFLLGACAALAACSGDALPSGEPAEAAAPGAADPHKGHHMGPSAEAAKEKREFVEVFVEHFGAQTCDDSELIGTMRRTEADGAGEYTRAYQSSAACADDLKGILETRGFAQPEDGVFLSETRDGTTEKVVIRLADEGSRAGIEWEVVQK